MTEQEWLASTDPERMLNVFAINSSCGAIDRHGVFYRHVAECDADALLGKE